jgi:hypothetical protein
MRVLLVSTCCLSPRQFDIDAAALQADRWRRTTDWAIVSAIDYATDEAERLRKEDELLTEEEYIDPSGFYDHLFGPPPDHD